MNETTISPEERAKLTLQQKFVMIRASIPRISQKAHSDGVKYKFIKINEIYEYLTPIMNAVGVNFEIIKETPTRHYENGDARYYDYYTQQTKSGSRIVWVYEADLTLLWVNADNPSDKQEVTLHAIGTNDSGPDKAKGSSWTYALKYYFFEKLGIDQSEDDPDMSDHSSDAPPTSQNRSTAPQNGAGGRNTQTPAENAGNRATGAQKPLSDAQLSRMYRKGGDAGYTQEQINDWIAKKYGQQDPHSMTRAQYDEICEILDENAKQKGSK